MKKKGMTYKDAGVDIDAGNLFAQMIKELVEEAWPGRGNEIGGFSGGGPIPHSARKVSGSTDSVGTKLKIAGIANQIWTVAQDAVAMSAVDMYVSGKKPLYLYDCLSVEKLDPENHIHVIEGLIHACKLAGCKLSGGETAELPGFFKHPWMFDIVTFVIGFPDPALTFTKIKPGYPVYGWLSGGPASNGFSLIRKVFKLDDSPSVVEKRLWKRRKDLNGDTLANTLLAPTPIYIQNMEEQRKRGVRFAGHAHNTGGSFPDNVPRMLPENVKVVIDRSKWERPCIFSSIQKLGNISTADMDRTFNNGIMVVSIVDPAGKKITDQNAVLIGEVKRRKIGDPAVELIGTYRNAAYC